MTSFQTIDPVSIGTGVAKTTLGTVNKPSESQCLIEFTPYQCPVITTTAESLLTETAIESQSVIDILPKHKLQTHQLRYKELNSTLVILLQVWHKCIMINQITKLQLALLQQPWQATQLLSMVVEH